MSGVFISYRRDDSRGSAGRLYDDLSDKLGTHLVFRDLDTIQPGAIFGEAIATAIAGCDALVAVIGDRWLDARDARGQRRVDDPKDLVRIEIVTALAQDKVVIPVLVEDAEMPSEPDLPAVLAPLATRNAWPVSDQRWEHDVGRLVTLLDDLVGRQPPSTSPEPPAVPSAEPPSGNRRRRTVAIPAAIVLALVALGAFALGRNSGGEGAGTDVATAGRDVGEPASGLPTATGATSGETAEGAIPISVGDTVENGKPPGAGNIASPGAMQRYSFTGTAGQVLYLKTLYKGPGADLVGEILAPSGSVIAVQGMGGDLGRVTLSANGTHTIQVSSYGTGSYGFVVTAVP